MQIANTIVGWKEWIGLPDLGIPFIKAKIDTGAVTASLHAYNIKLIEQHGVTYASFEIHPIQKNNKISIACIEPVIAIRKVKSSNGKVQARPVIATNIQIAKYIYRIELNLTNRDAMGIRMLIGRKGLQHVLVNPINTYLHGRLSEHKLSNAYAMSISNKK